MVSNVFCSFFTRKYVVQVTFSLGILETAKYGFPTVRTSRLRHVVLIVLAAFLSPDSMKCAHRHAVTCIDS